MRAKKDKSWEERKGPPQAEGPGGRTYMGKHADHSSYPQGMTEAHLKDSEQKKENFLVYWSSKRHMTLGILAGTQSRAARASSASGEFLTNTSLFIPSHYYISTSLASPLPQNTAKQRKNVLEN